jgi:membrane associated rhomboid family serine protease
MVKKLIIANAFVFGIQILSPLLFGWSGLGISVSGGPGGFTLEPMGRYFALVPELFVESGFLWTLVSYQFLHGGVFHILINMFILWMFGTEVERLWDQASFLQFYLVCGIAAGLTMVLVNYGRTPESLIPVVGASGAIFGLLGAFGYYWPEREVYVWGIFPMKVKYFITFIAGFELLISISETQLGVANMAHLGGLAMGLAYVHFGDPSRSVFDSIQRWAKEKKVERKQQQWQQEQKKRDEMVKEADEILDKLKELSWEELSDEEQRRIREISDKLDDYDRFG